MWKNLLHQPQQQKERPNKRARKNVFGVSKSEQLDITTRRLADYMGKKYGGTSRNVIKNHTKKKMNHPEDIYEITTTRTEQLLQEANI